MKPQKNLKKLAMHMTFWVIQRNGNKSLKFIKIWFGFRSASNRICFKWLIPFSELYDQFGEEGLSGGGGTNMSAEELFASFFSFGMGG
jgi:hypothetical protein